MSLIIQIKKNINVVEIMQRRANKLIPGLRYLRYEERLNKRMWSNNTRNTKIEILDGYENIDCNL